MKAVWSALIAGVAVIVLLVVSTETGIEEGRIEQRQKDAREIAFLKSLKTVPATTCTVASNVVPVPYCVGALPSCPPGWTCTVMGTPR